MPVTRTADSFTRVADAAAFPTHHINPCNRRKTMLRRTDDKFERYPLRQPLSPAVDGLAIFSRRGPVEWLSKPGSYLVVCERDGGLIYAANERALVEAWEEIAAVHGNAVIGGEPQVHRMHDAASGAAVEPLMFVRLKVARGFAAAIIDGLERRGARIIEKNLRGVQSVIRAEARLADLLGFEAAVQALTHGAATVWIWLLRYEEAAQDAAPRANARPSAARREEEEAETGV